MDGSRFDAFARFLATRPSRRQLVRGLAGGVLATVLGREAAGATCATLGRPCTADSDCCSGSCTMVAPGHGVCAACPASTCGTNEYQDPRDCTCRCVFSQQVCGAGEVCDLAAHGCTPATIPPTETPGPCGGVGATCTTGDDCCAPNVCANGACAAACPPGSRECDRICYPGGCCTAADCGLACEVCADHVCQSCDALGQVCQDGACVSPTPPPPPPPACGPANCRGCCDADGVCQLGTSRGVCGTNGAACAACATGQDCCDGACTDLCGSVCCPAGQRCCGAQCCPSGQTCCGDVCCPAGNICCGATCCAAGSCCAGVGVCCPTGQICCGDQCTDLNDPENCGACDNTCAPNQVCTGTGGCCTPATCQAGQCGTISDGCGGTLDCGACAAGQTCCGGDCANLQTDPANCGTCGHACPAGQGCCNGTCANLCNGACCGSGHECVHGGCFQVSTGFNCQDCGEYCNALCGTVDGSGNTLCLSVTNTGCDTNADCPAGQACTQGGEETFCATPC